MKECNECNMQMDAGDAKCNEMQDGVAKKMMTAAIGKAPNSTRKHLFKMQRTRVK